jgi:hypothetical protein
MGRCGSEDHPLRLAALSGAVEAPRRQRGLVALRPYELRPGMPLHGAGAERSDTSIFVSLPLPTFSSTKGGA